MANHSPLLTQSLLNSINVEQARTENRAKLDEIGGVDGLVNLVGVKIVSGLSKQQVTEMRAKFGDNTYPESPMDSYFTLLLEALSDTTLLILLVAATVSFFIGYFFHPPKGWIEGAAIFIAVFLVSNISAANDYSKQLQFKALENSAAEEERTSVLRDGNVERINPKDVVVGDILVLQAGDMIPADSVIIDKNVVLCNEASLTGEPDDLKKSKEKDCFLLSSCLVTDGEECKALAIGIGTFSQWGKIKANLASEAVHTPLQDKLASMTKFIGKIGLFFALGTFMGEVVRIWTEHHGENIRDGFLHAFILAVTVVVVAIPEGLPLAVTIALAYSTKKMFRDNCLIRVLAACETMGNATNICSDKTGTLTENRMTVVEGWFAGAIYNQEEFERAPMSSQVKKLLADHLAINRTAYLVYKDQEGHTLDRPQIIGNKTEGALIFMIRSWGFDYDQVKAMTYNEEKDKVYAFNSGKKRSTAVVHQSDGSVRIFCKGASEWILKDCTQMLNSSCLPVPMTADKKADLERHILSMAENALRTLCIAHRDFSSASDLPHDWRENPPDHENLCLDCIVGIIDPLRGDVKEAVRVAQQAGVIVRMVTGDNIATACAIARQCGILTPTGLAIEGPTFRKMKPRDVDNILPRLQVMARSSPDDKYLLVTRLNGYGIPDGQAEWEGRYKGMGYTWEKDRDLIMPGYREEWEESRPEGGQVVGVTGDGTNDAPALKAADVGLAMGITGTKVAQCAADIVIRDDRFSSIVRAICWGRSVYDSVRRFLQFQLTVNVCAMFLVFICAIAGYEVPLNAVQLLWVNLVMDTMGALALATEEPTPELLKRKPYKRSASLLSRPMIRHICFQAIFQIILLMILNTHGPEYFGVNKGGSCAKFKVKNGNRLWDLSTKQRSNSGTFSCDDFQLYCRGKGTECLSEKQTIVSNGTSYYMALSSLHNYEDQCLNCIKNDYTINTIVFNTFIFCQIFNEYNARSITDDFNIIKGLTSNPTFLTISVITIGFQIILVEFGGEFIKTTPLTTSQWLITVGLGAIVLPLGFIMRLLPMPEDPNSFFDNAQDFIAAKSDLVKDGLSTGQG